MTIHVCINSIGLLLDIVGVILVWKYGLGKPLFIKNSDDKDIPILLGDQTKAQSDHQLEMWGMGFILIGFVLQLLSNWV